MVHEGRAPPPPPPPVNAAAAPRALVADEPEEIRVVRDYVRPARAAAGAVQQQFAVSPITGELIPLAEMAEHMRISLLDPRWREQRESMLNKIRDTTRAGDDEITNNIIALARTRPDIFGSTDEEVGRLVAASIEEKKISGVNRPIAWDGVVRLFFSVYLG